MGRNRLCRQAARDAGSLSPRNLHGRVPGGSRSFSEDKATPLFRTAAGKTGKLTDLRMARQDARRMISHSFRATGITVYPHIFAPRPWGPDFPVPVLT